MDNPIIRIFCISEWLAVTINPDKWSSAVLNTEEMIPTGGKNTVLGENPYPSDIPSKPILT